MNTLLYLFFQPLSKSQNRTMYAACKPRAFVKSAERKSGQLGELSAFGEGIFCYLWGVAKNIMYWGLQNSIYYISDRLSSPFSKKIHKN